MFFPVWRFVYTISNYSFDQKLDAISHFECRERDWTHLGILTMDSLRAANCGVSHEMFAAGSSDFLS